MADQTDFTQIAADFAANLKPVRSTGNGAVASRDSVVDGTTAGEVSEVGTLPVAAFWKPDRSWGQRRHRDG